MKEFKIKRDALPTRSGNIALRLELDLNSWIREESKKADISMNSFLVQAILFAKEHYDGG